MTTAAAGIAVRPAQRADYPGIVALNADAVQHTSAMDIDRLEALAGLACYLKVAIADNGPMAFLLAMRDGVPYDNDNYRWFSAHGGRFIYIDRIVVGAAHAGRGIGRQLYEDLFGYARSQDILTVTCEYNVEPPNPASAAFHQSLGFKEIGTQWLAQRSKRVSMQSVQL